MAASEGYTGAYIYSSPTKSPTRPSRRPSTQNENRRVEEDDVVQGRIFWLPPKEELPDRAVRRAHGKGAIEEGIYNHPIVVISRPAEDAQMVHFHLITSFQGKKLNEIYGKSNEFHASRRSWYLPISPTPDHPDATSKKSRKRFPTLDLAGGAVLRWDSYVNLRHVYRIEWSLLKPYSNPDTPYNQLFRFERESMIRLLAKSKVLTTYEVGTQWQNREGTQRPQPAVDIPFRSSSNSIQPSNQERAFQEVHPQSPRSSISIPRSSSEYSTLYSPIRQSDFLASRRDGHRNLEAPPKAPPDKIAKQMFLSIRNVLDSVWRWLWDIARKVLERIRL